MKAKDLIYYILVGAGTGYMFYKFTHISQAQAEPLPKSKVTSIPKKKETIALISFPVPKTVGSKNLERLISLLKPARILPSTKPLGVKLEWNPIMLDTPIGKTGWTPPDKFIPSKTIPEIKGIIDKARVDIKDKGIYWKVSLLATI